MKKEVFLAVLVGFGLGLIITFGIWAANKNLKPQTTTTAQIITPSPAPAATNDTKPAPTSGTTLAITSPEDNEILVSSNQLSLSGKTIPGNTVAITHETGQQLLVADASGNFSLDLALEGGYNRISITAFDPNGNSTTREILVTYSSTKI